MKINIAGVLVDDVTNLETLELISDFVKSGRPHHIVTTYSEFVVEASKNPKYKDVINHAALSVPDGIGILWAAKFLSLPQRDPVITVLNWFGTLCSIVLAPQSLRSTIREQVSGSRLVWDIASKAKDNGFTLALVGGFDGVAEKSAQVLQEKFPGLKINLAYGPEEFNQEVVSKINQSNSDILLVAYQPPKQEIWIADNLEKLNVKVAIGLGGTFDYLAGQRTPAPERMHKLGLEWLWRLITQPWRIKRIWRALAEFSYLVLQYKLQK